MKILSTKLKKALEKEAAAQSMEITIQLKNIIVNSDKRGCSGFVTNKNSGTCVYVNTESSCFEPLKNRTMYRFAYNDKDYSSNQIKNGYNQFCESDPAVIASSIIRLLTQAPAQLKEGYDHE